MIFKNLKNYKFSFIVSKIENENEIIIDTCQGTINNQEISISCTKSRVFIEVSIRNKLYYLKGDINNEETVKKITNNHLETVIDLYENLKAALINESCNEDTVLTLDLSNFKLIYKIRAFRKDFN